MTTNASKPLSPVEQQVFDAFVEHGPMTDEQLVERSGVGMRTASPRRRILADRGYLEEVGTGTTRSGRKAKVWGVVPVERVAEVAEAASQRDPRRRPVTKLPLQKKMELVRQLLDDEETNAAILEQRGRAWRRVRGRTRDRKSIREHERREILRQLREQEKDPTGLVDFLKTKRNLLDVIEAMRGTTEFVKEEMRIRGEYGMLRIPPGYWPEVQDLLGDLEDMGREASQAIDAVLGRLGDDVIEGDAIVVSELELPEGAAD
jgi:hypothetical protein